MTQTSVDLWFPELDQLIGSWRKSNVPAASFGVAPHISLLFPWITEAPSAQYLSRLKDALMDLEPFDLAFVGLRRFPGVLWLAPEPREAVQNLMHRITKAFPEFPPYGGQFTDPVPHLAVAKGQESVLLEIEREIEQILPEISKLQFPINHVSIVLEGSDGWWSIAAQVEFGPI